MSKKRTVWLIIILIGLCTLIGISYAIWRLTLSQTGNNRIATGCLNLELIKEENLINLQNAYPMYDEEGKTLTPYSFTITNTCDMFASYMVQLEMTETSTLPIEYIRAMINNEAIENLNEYEESTDYVNTDTTEARILARGSLGNGDSEDYTLRLWIDSDVDQTTTDAIGKTLSAKITITASPSTYSPIDYGFTTLHDAILANEYQVTELQTAIDKINQKQEPDFTQTAPIIEWQENSTTSSGTLSYTMPRVEDVGSDLDYASNLTESNVRVGFATSYRFDAEEGKYYLENMIYQDPTTIDFSSQNYYICNAGTNVTSANRLSPYNNTNCTTIYQISGYTGSASATVSGSDGTSYPATRYSFTRSRTYNQTELESDKSDKGLYTVEDDYGTSYYYRGSVKNNYVYFAGFYWRIIRINGNGTIRMICDGTVAHPNGESSTDRQAGTSQFNQTYTDNMYVGYMYTNGEVHGLETSSVIKQANDNFYTSNLASYESYIDTNAGFCGDRSTLNLEPRVGTGTVTTFSKGYMRVSTSTPSLICEDVNDLYTTPSSSKGNKVLTYPIGLITADEVMLSGNSGGFFNGTYSYQKSTLNSYLTTGNNFWTLTPVGGYNTFGITYWNALVFNMTSSNKIDDNSTNHSYGLRPVINIRSDVTVSGNGTMQNPYYRFAN